MCRCRKKKEDEDMSLKYFIIDMSRQAAIQDLELLLAQIKEDAVAALDNCCHEQQTRFSSLRSYEGAGDLVSVVRERLVSALEDIHPMERHGNDAMLGCSMRSGFTWATWNGFACVSDVALYRDAHPNCHIEDEEGTTISWDAFANIAEPKPEQTESI